MMGLKLTCDGCGKGVVSALRKINGRYLCPNCELNPTGEVRYQCTACNSYLSFGKRKGSTFVAFVLYCLAIVPGILYSTWRRSAGGLVCPRCNHATLVPASTSTHVRCPDCRELVLKDARKCKHCLCALVPQ